MKEVIHFIAGFFVERQETRINLPVLIITLIILFTALIICIIISRKNQLYIRSDKQTITEIGQSIITKNEAAS